MARNFPKNGGKNDYGFDSESSSEDIDRRRSAQGNQYGRSDDVNHMLKMNQGEFSRLISASNTESRSSASGRAYSESDTAIDSRLRSKKEKNRLAAKKSREKKARQIAELEIRSDIIGNINRSLNGYLNEYEIILENVLTFVNCVLRTSLKEGRVMSVMDEGLNKIMTQSLDKLRYFLRRLCIMINTDQYMRRTPETDSTHQLRITQILNETMKLLNEYFEMFKEFNF